MSTSTTTTTESGKPVLTLRPSSENDLLVPPLRYKGSFDKYDKFNISPAIGVEFRKGAIDLKQLLYAENSDELLLDLAVYIAERGVILFRDQKLTPQEHSLLVQKLSSLPRGKTAEEADLHIHPMTHSNPDIGDHFVKIYSSLNTVYKGHKRERTQRGTGLFHSDLNYEKRPADISALQMTKVPQDGGGDTIFGSGYHAYDKVTPVFAQFLEKLTAHSDWISNLKLFDKQTGDHYREKRGSKENQGSVVESDHPLVRTNPITGWKSIYYSVIHNKYINELDFDESATVMQFMERLLTENQEYLIRLRWEENDIAIWDNRSTFHSATIDYEGYREGYRVTALGEFPYLDPNSVSRKQYLDSLKKK